MNIKILSIIVLLSFTEIQTKNFCPGASLTTARSPYPSLTTAAPRQRTQENIGRERNNNRNRNLGRLFNQVARIPVITMYVQGNQQVQNNAPVNNRLIQLDPIVAQMLRVRFSGQQQVLTEIEEVAELGNDPLFNN